LSAPKTEVNKKRKSKNDYTAQIEPESVIRKLYDGLTNKILLLLLLK